MRENKVSLHARWHTLVQRDVAGRKGVGNEGSSEVLINIFSGIRGEIKLTARICESFVTGYSSSPFLSHSLTRYL